MAAGDILILKKNASDLWAEVVFSGSSSTSRTLILDILGLSKVFPKGTTSARIALGALLGVDDTCVFIDTDDKTTYTWSGTEWY